MDIDLPESVKEKMRMAHEDMLITGTGVLQITNEEKEEIFKAITHRIMKELGANNDK